MSFRRCVAGVAKNRVFIALRSVSELLRFPTRRAIRFNSWKWRIQRSIKRSVAYGIATVRIGFTRSQATQWRGLALGRSQESRPAGVQVCRTAHLSDRLVFLIMTA